VISHGHCSDFFKFEQIFVKDFNPKLGVRWVRWIWMSWTEHAWEVGNSKRIIIRVCTFCGIRRSLPYDFTILFPRCDNEILLVEAPLTSTST
jgi:hypothetical protein